MKRTYVFVWTLLIACSLQTGASHADKPGSQQPARPTQALHTVAVIDTSGSMAQDDRLKTAIAELKHYAKALPPSPETPWTVIPFHETTYNTHTFTSGLAELEAYLTDLEAGGGTSIASGLEEALKAIRNSNAQRINIMLYTDGEDDDQAGIQKQQERLAALFDERTERGLGQAVICRRWGGANKQFVDYLEKKKVQVFDAGEAKLMSLVLTPEVQCLGTRWLPDRQVLEIRLRALVHGPAESIPQYQPPPLHFACTTAQAQGDITFDVSMAEKGNRPLTIMLPFTPDVGLSSVRLDFEVSTPSAKQLAQTLVFPSLAKDRLSVLAQVPIVYLTANSLSATPPVWTNLAEGTASFEASVRIRVDGALRDSITLGLVAPPGVRSVQCRPALLRSGEQTVTILLVAVLRPAAATTFTFALQPYPLPTAWHLHVPKPLQVRVLGPAPVRIGLAHCGQVPGTIEADLPNGGSAVLVNLRPVVLGTAGPGATRGLSVATRADGALQFPGDAHWSFSRESSVHITPRDGTFGRSFFQDLFLEGSVTFEPVPPSPCVVGTTQKFVLRCEAPFRKFLFIGSVGFFSLVVVFVLGRFFWKMSTSLEAPGTIAGSSTVARERCG